MKNRHVLSGALLSVILLLALLAGCTSQAAPQSTVPSSVIPEQSTAEAAAAPDESGAEEFDYLPQQRALAVLWQQESGEAKALRYQAYNAAKAQVDALVAKGLSGKEAVVLDIDETVLDNVPFAAQLVHDNVNYSGDLWNDWVAKAQAEEVHGATDFIKYAQDNGLEVFLVSNRKEEPHADATEQNLIDLGIQVPRENMFLRTEESNKQARFDTISETHDIVMYVGDNLVDFPNDYNSKPNEERSEIVIDNKDDFGTVYIVLPNPMNGDFESALVDYDPKRPSSEVLDIREGILKPFQ